MNRLEGDPFMDVWNWLIVFAGAALGCLVVLVIAKVWARHRKDDGEFQRQLALGGRLTPTCERVGLHASGQGAVEELQLRIRRSSHE